MAFNGRNTRRALQIISLGVRVGMNAGEVSCASISSPSPCERENQGDSALSELEIQEVGML